MHLKHAKTDHPIQHDLAARYSPYAFADRSVPPEDLRSLFEAARWAASSYNEQPWSFILATRDDAEGFERLASCLVPGNRAWASRAPVLALSVAKRTFDLNGKANAHAWHDVGLAVANLTLQAQSMGLAVHQMAGFDATRARDVLAIPADHAPVAALAIGYYADPASLTEEDREAEGKARSRRERATLVHGGRWGEALAGL